MAKSKPDHGYHPQHEPAEPVAPPDYPPDYLVTAALPGAAPAQLETDVARKVENAIASVQGLKHIYTKVQEGVVTVTAEFRLEKPVQEAVDDVRSAVSRVRADLPSDLRDPVVTKLDLAGQPILAFTIALTLYLVLLFTGPDMDDPGGLAVQDRQRDAPLVQLLEHRPLGGDVDVLDGRHVSGGTPSERHAYLLTGVAVVAVHEHFQRNLRRVVGHAAPGLRSVAHPTVSASSDVIVASGAMTSAARSDTPKGEPPDTFGRDPKCDPKTDPKSDR